MNEHGEGPTSDFRSQTSDLSPPLHVYSRAFAVRTGAEDEDEDDSIFPDSYYFCIQTIGRASSI